MTGLRTRSSLNLMCNYSFISILESKDIVSALEDSYWIMTMQDEFSQFNRTHICDLMTKYKRSFHHRY